jgi:hypothetical protein
MGSIARDKIVSQKKYLKSKYTMPSDDEVEFQESAAMSAKFRITCGGSVVQAGSSLADLTLLQTVSGYPQNIRDIAQRCTYHDVVVRCHGPVPPGHILLNPEFFINLTPPNPYEETQASVFYACRDTDENFLAENGDMIITFENKFNGPPKRYFRCRSGMGKAQFEPFT